MIKLYLDPEYPNNKPPIYRDKLGANYMFASPSMDHSLLFREITFLEDGSLLFYGQTFHEKDIEIIDTNSEEYKLMNKDIIYGMVKGVSQDGNLEIEMDNGRKLKVSSKYCSVPAARYIGQFYSFKSENIISEIIEIEK